MNTVEHAPYALQEHIVALSDADDWDRAKLEWELCSIYTSDPGCFGTCLCGHFPIVEHCVIENTVNGNTAIVGNVCVKRFLEIDADRLFSAFDRIGKDQSRALNAEAVEFCFKKKLINDWEYNFYKDTLRKRKLSEKQIKKREQINDNILRLLKYLNERD